MKKMLTLVLAAVLMLALSVTAFAQTENYTGADGDGAKITITNAANGVTYKVAKLFDATVTGSADGSIAYTGTIPAALSSYFTTDGAGNISATAALDLSNAAVQTALKTWAEANVTAQAVSDGTALDFTNLPYGYYIITTTQGEALLTVDSTNPNASVIDKNTTPPISNQTKTADDDDVFIGQTVTYTVSFDTANYVTKTSGGTTTSKQIVKYIVKYIVKDDFAGGALTDITVTSIKVGGTNIAVQQFDASGKIEIDWVDSAGKSIYANGAKLEITYTAKVADSAAVDGAGNKNTVTLDYEDTDGNGSPTVITTDKTIYTYAVAIQKVDQSGNPLSGAKFQLPFYVKDTPDAADGAYIYAGATAGTGLVNELTTPASGLIIIKGLQQGAYSFTETAAPGGYNKLTTPVTVNATQTGNTATSTTTYLDENGNVVSTASATTKTVTVSIADLAATAAVVVNKTGAELPTTGGIGTTLFYMIGGILVVGAAVALVSKKRMEE